MDNKKDNPPLLLQKLFAPPIEKAEACIKRHWPWWGKINFFNHWPWYEKYQWHIFTGAVVFLLITVTCALIKLLYRAFH
jgi:hypothetical protein